MNIVKLICMSVLSTHISIQAQNNPFVGTFVNSKKDVALRIKPMTQEYHGIVQTNTGNMAFKGTVSGKQLIGKFYSPNGTILFSATQVTDGLMLSFNNIREIFYLTSTNHEIQNVDLSTYFYPDNTSKQGNGTTAQNQPSKQQTSVPKSDNTTLRQAVAGSQLVVWNKPNPLLTRRDQRTSSAAYLNFCANGTVLLAYDSYFDTKQKKNDWERVAGASNGTKKGKWYATTQEGKSVFKATFEDGTSGTYWVNQQQINQGSWEVHRTKFIFNRGKAVCQ
ncbi:MAG: hypothetical protein ACFB0B_06555 [Thermonemataceae bacterium]